MTAQFVSVWVLMLLSRLMSPCVAPAQEHTILLRPTVKEVVSRGDDY